MLVKELQSLGLSVELINEIEEKVALAPETEEPSLIELEVQRGYQLLVDGDADSDADDDEIPAQAKEEQELSG